jgi:glycosyltransferase involved in cell wall biosynthesis
MTHIIKDSISVIIPTYNRAKYVTMAIDSVLNQTFKDYEIIVVDDGSTDNTREALNPYMGRIQYIYQSNEGVSSARNKGILKSKGVWIAFIDADDEWLPEKLYIQMDAVSKTHRICVHVTNANLHLKKGKMESNMEITGFLKEAINPIFIERPLKYQIKYGLARVPCIIVKREALLDAGLFDTRLTMFEDQDLMCRLALQGPWGVNVLELVNIYRREEEIENLSQQRIFKPISSYGGLINSYKKLNQNPNISSEEKDLLGKEISSQSATVGMELLKAKCRYEAHRILWESMKDSPSIKSLSRYLLSFLPFFLSAPLIRRWHKFKRG